MDTRTLGVLPKSGVLSSMSVRTRMSTAGGLLLLVPTSLLAIACEQPMPLPATAVAVRAECPSAENDEYYFPDSTVVPANSDTDYRQRHGYSSLLKRAGLRSISCGDPTVRESYRVVRVNSRSPVLVIQLSNSGNVGRLRR